MRAYWALPALLMLAVGLVPAAPRKAPADPYPLEPLPKVEVLGVECGLLPTPADAVRAAWDDSARLGEAAPFFRYVWVTTGHPRTAHATVVALNYTAHTRNPVRPERVTWPGRGLLLRFDLRRLAPKTEDLARFVELWEDYQNDPKFSLLITGGIVRSLHFPGEKVPLVKVKKKVTAVDHGPPVPRNTEVRTYQHPGGEFTYPPGSVKAGTVVTGDHPAGPYEVEYYAGGADLPPAVRTVGAVETVEVKLTDVKDVGLVRLPGEFLPRKEYAELCDRLRTAAPVVSHDYLIQRHLTTLNTVDRDDLYSELYGGRYYDFMLYERKPAKGTEEEAILQSQGIETFAVGKTLDDLFDELGSDSRVGMLRSDVTGAGRIVRLLRSLNGNLIITDDSFHKSVDIDQSAFSNLLRFRSDGHEGIFELANGLHGFYITNNKGELQDVAPQNLVEDHETPRPHPSELQCAFSCIRCHNKGNEGGWKKLRNDVRSLLSGKRLRVLGDKTDLTKTLDEERDRLRGLYDGDPEVTTLPRARDDYAKAILRVTGPWADSKDQTDLVRLLGDELTAVYGGRVYEQVDARTALAELGLAVPGDKAAELFDALLPPVAEAGVVGVVPEDWRIGALCPTPLDPQGLKLNRHDWDLVYGFAAARFQFGLAAAMNLNEKEGQK